MGLPRRRIVLIGPLLCLLTFTSCQTIQTRYRDWSQYDGPGAAEFREPEPPPPPALPDPLQPLNRAMFDFNVGLLDHVIEPLAEGWRVITSKSVREHITKFGKNLEFPVRLVANLLEGEVKRASVETGRFVINTTVGLLGFFDPAEDFGLPAPPREDIGQAFGTWGWDAQFDVHLPFAGPSSDRDATGRIFNTALDPATYISYFFPLRSFLWFNDISDSVDSMLRLEHGAEDPYEVVRTAAQLYRTNEVVDYSEAGGTSPEQTTLQTVFFDAQDPEFLGQRKERSVRIPATGHRLPYDLWLQEEPGPLVYILPGLGSHRYSGQAVGVAEMAFQAGCSAVSISSAMHPEFMSRAATAPLPGYVPWDAADLLGAIAAVDEDLARDYPERFTLRGLAGVSLGALDALFLAVSPGGDAFDAVVAINPPVSAQHALKQLDRLYRAALEWPATEREARIRNLLLKVVRLAEGSLEPTDELPFGPLEADYLIGLSFRWTLRSVIFDSQLRAPQGVLLTELDRHDREPAYREIGQYGYMEYAYAFMLPTVLAREPDVRDDVGLFARCDLHGLQAALAADGRVRVLTNRDDFLLEDGDVEFLQATLGERLVLFEEGGHLGNLSRPGVRLAITEALRQALAAPVQN